MTRFMSFFRKAVGATENFAKENVGKSITASIAAAGAAAIFVVVSWVAKVINWGIEPTPG